MARKIQFKRGAKANLPKLSPAELAFTTDEKKAYIGDGNENIRLLDEKDKAEITTQLTEKAKQSDVITIQNTLPNKADKSYADTKLSEKRDKSQALMLADLHTEVKTAMTGGSVPVVGVESVGAENVKQKSILLEHTTFAKRSEDNLFTGEFKTGLLSGNSPYELVTTMGGKYTVAVVEPNTTYHIRKSTDSDRFRIGTFVESPIAGSRPTKFQQSDAVERQSITTGASDKYIVIVVASGSTSAPTNLQISKTPTDLWMPINKVKIDLGVDSIPSLPHTKLDFVKKNPLNLFSGTFVTGLLSGASPYDFVTGAGGRCAIERVSPSTEYTIMKTKDTNRFRIALFSNQPVQGSVPTKFFHYDGVEKATILTGDNDNYIVVLVSGSTENKDPSKFMITEGNTDIFEPMFVVDGSKVGFHTETANVAKLTPASQYAIEHIKENYVMNSTPILRTTINNDLNAFYALYDKLVTDFPDYVTKTVIGREKTGLPINRYDFKPPLPHSYTDTYTPKILYTSGIHGDEQRSMIDGLLLFRDICTNWKNNSVLRFLRWNIHFIVVPAMNPHGFTQNYRLNSNSVDLNRNFTNGWVAGGSGTAYYSGTSALSELETQAMDQLLQTEKNISFAINHHNYNIYPTSSEHIVWTHSLNEESKKMLLGFTSYANAELKARHNSLPQDNTPLVAYIPQTISGMVYQQFENRGIPGMILEIVQSFNGSDEDYHKYGTSILGNLMVGVAKHLIK